MLAATAFPYLSLRYQDAALINSTVDREGALKQARFATRLLPVSPGPATVEADIYETTARSATRTDGTGEGAVLDALALSLDARQRAIELDPSSWSLRYSAGLSALALSEKMRAAENRSAGRPEAAEAGQDPGTPASTQEQIQTAGELRALTVGEMEFLARAHLEAARDRNPLSVEVAAALDILNPLQ